MCHGSELNLHFLEQIKINYGLFYWKKLGLNFILVIREFKQVIQSKHCMI